MSNDSSNSSYRFVRVDEFTPNSGAPWTSFGNVASVVQDSSNGPAFTLTGVAPQPGLPPPVLRLYLIGPAAFRVRFKPGVSDYTQDGSYAVVNRNLGPLSFTVLQDDGEKLSVNLSADVRLDVLRNP
jgi:alpha-glucosidase